MLRVVRAFGRERHEFRKFRQQGETAVDARIRVTTRQTVFSLAVNTITAVGTALVLSLGALHVLDNKLTVGELLVVMGYIAAIYQPLESISNAVSSLQQHFIGVRRAFQLLDTKPEIEDRPDARTLEKAQGAVAFEDVSFSYTGRERTLSDISFRVEPGQRVALVGQTGAGKTTLISLLMRFYDTQRGRVLIDGHDVRELQLESLCAQMSVVLQEPLLFSGTIAENIRYGRLDAADEDLVAAAQAANAHDFISALPDGYQTMIGERGSQLSGGERQRVCVARAFLKDAPILILDEPTSSIDSKTESLILDALERLMEGRTTFMIAHRLSTIRHADVILVLSAGELVEQGTHEELIAHSGVYRQLWEMQIGWRRRATTRAAAAGPHPVEPPRKVVVPAGGNGAGGSVGTIAWTLFDAIAVFVADGSANALAALAAQRESPDPQQRLAGELAAGLLEGGVDVHEIWRDAQALQATDESIENGDALRNLREREGVA
jgi:ATP-binding cassette subfamily B protein